MYNIFFDQCPFIRYQKDIKPFYFCGADNQPCNKNCTVHTNKLQDIGGVCDIQNYCISHNFDNGTCKKTGLHHNDRCTNCYTLTKNGFLGYSENITIEKGEENNV